MFRRIKKPKKDFNKINKLFITFVFYQIMRKIYYLASCDTCRKIIKSLPKNANLEFHDIRQNPLTLDEVEQMKHLASSYEALFSKKAQLYKERNLKNSNLTELDFKNLILEHYTFLSRPVVIINDNIFIGNTQPNILKLNLFLANE